MLDRKCKIGPKFGLRPSEVAFAFGSEKLFQECVAAGWLKPIVQRHKLTLFDHDEVAHWRKAASAAAPPSQQKQQRRLVGIIKYQHRQGHEVSSRFTAYSMGNAAAALQQVLKPQTPTGKN